MITFSVQRSAFSVQRSAFSVQCSAFSVQCLAFSVQCLAFEVWREVTSSKADGVQTHETPLNSSISSAITRPISRDAVAAGEGALQT